MNWLNLNLLRPGWLLPLPPDSTVAYIIMQFRNFCGMQRFVSGPLFTSISSFTAGLQNCPAGSVPVPAAGASRDQVPAPPAPVTATSQGAARPSSPPAPAIAAGRGRRRWPRPLYQEAAGNWKPAGWCPIEMRLVTSHRIENIFTAILLKMLYKLLTDIFLRILQYCKVCFRGDTHTWNLGSLLYSTFFGYIPPWIYSTSQTAI